MSTVRVGIIGAGGIAAKFHLPEMQTVHEAEVRVLAGRQESRLKLLCQRFHVPRWSQSYEEVLSDPQLDAVIIALPHPLHVKYGILALEAGKHILMQKPLCTSMQEADEFVTAVEKSDRTVLALPYVSRPHVLAARKFVNDGVLGTVASAHARFSHGGPEVYYATVQKLLNEAPVEDLWFFDSQRAEVGALFDMGVYAISHLVAILGSVRAVTCRTSTLSKPTDLEDTAVLILEFESGAIGTAETGWCDGAKTYEFSIHGTAGKLTNPSLTHELIHAQPQSTSDEDAPLKEVAVDLSSSLQQNAHQHWIECIAAQRQPPLANVSFARHVTEIMLRGLESSREKRTLPIHSRIETSQASHSS